MNHEFEDRERAKWKSRRRRQRHTRNGLCLECGRKPVSGRRFCAAHLARARAKTKQEYEWRVANGICVKCGIPKEEERRGVNCISCARKAATKQRERRVCKARDGFYSKNEGSSRVLSDSLAA